MTSSNGMFYTEKSMNGIITLSDGQGVEISDGDISSATIHTDNIQAINPADDVYLFTNSTGVIHTGFNNTFSSNNLQGTTITSNITLFTNTTSGNIDLGTGLLSTATNTIGNSVCKNKVGNVIITDKTFTTPNTTDTVNLFNNIVSGNITLGTGGTSGSITIGTTNTTDLFLSNLNIRGSEIYGRAVSATCGLFDNLTTGICNIATGISTNATGINIGSALTTGFCSIGGGSTTTGGLKLYSPITMAYTALTTPNSNQIGYTFAVNPPNVSLPTANVLTTIYTFTLPVGVWLVTGSATPNVNAGTYWSVGYSVVTPPVFEYSRTNSMYCNIGGLPCLTTSVITSTNPATNYYLFVQCGIINTALAIYHTRIRIA